MNLDIRQPDMLWENASVEGVARNAFAEAMLVLGEGVASVRDIDDIMRETAGFPLGPFELLLDRVNLDILPSPVPSDPPSDASPGLRLPPLMTRRLVARGEFAAAAANMPGQDLRPVRVWVAQGVPEWAAELRALVARAGVTVDDGQRPARDALIIVTPLGQDATTLCTTQGLDPKRTVAVDCLFGLARRRTVMTTPLTSDDMLDAAIGLFSADGSSVTAIRDSAGMVAQRIVAVLVNAACNLAQQLGFAAEEIDRAARLQLGYAQGPLALGDAIGPRRLLAALEAMLEFSGDPRYRASPWLKRRALLGAPLLGA